MDSANSGSVQSSRGADEEYDSRSQSMPAFLNPSLQFSTPPPQPQHHQPPFSHASPLLQSLSDYLGAFSQLASPQSLDSLQNHDMNWRGIRSGPAAADISGLFSSSISSASNEVALADRDARASIAPSCVSDRLPEQQHLIRNSKKRSRASRRAPTTVLTTDTSNFRAMVQEFTGIPSLPFSSPQNRLDLLSSTSRSGLENSSSSIFLRPFSSSISQLCSSSLSSASIFEVLRSGSPASTSTSDLNLQKNSREASFSFNSFQPTVSHYASGLQAFGSKRHTENQAQVLDTSIMDEFSVRNLNAKVSGIQATDPMDGQWVDANVHNEDNQTDLERLNRTSDDSPQSISICPKGATAEQSKRDGVVDSWICSSD